MMSFFKLQNGKPNYVSSIVTLCLLLWVVLIASSFYIAHGASKISILAAKIEFGVHFITLALLIQILWKSSRENWRPIIWLLAINLWLFFVDFFFYIAAYANNTYLLHMSFLEFVLYYAPCIVYCFIMIAFLAKILLKEVLHVRGFVKIISLLLVINIITIVLFSSSIQYAFGIISWESISQMAMLSTELVLFDFAILGLIYADNSSVFLLLTGTIFLIIGDFFLTYSSISQTVALFSYGELFWLLGLLFIFFSVVSIKQNRHYSIQAWFRKGNMIKSRLALWAVGTSISGFLLFFIIAYVFAIVDKRIFVGLPLYVMLYSIIAVIFSIFMGRNFETPFTKLTKNIQIFMSEHNKSNIDKDFSIEEFVFLNQFVIDAIEIIEERDQVKKNLGEIAAQVVHDIRSPAGSLEAHTKNLPNMPEAQRIGIRNAVNNINDIANNLLARYKGVPEDQVITYQVWLLAPLIESVVSEKRANLDKDKDRILIDSKITDAGFAAFAKCDSNQVKRMLSNLINNAVQAFGSDQKGHITVTLDATQSNIELAVIDDGVGMTLELVSKILQGAGNTTKDGGHGLGLKHVKQTIESWGGDFRVSSKAGEGTKISLNLTPAKAPTWFVSEIRVSPDVLIGVLDDYQAVHDAWEQRLSEVSKDLQIHHFSTSQSFIDWYQDQTTPVQVFSDYELLGDEMTGLEVLEYLDLGKNALLVTSHYENPEIMERCQKRGIRLLPKNLVAHVPIILKKTAVAKAATVAKKYDLVLLDDTPAVTESWEMVAMSTGKNILAFNTIEALEDALDGIDPATPFYIDSELGHELRGEVYAEGLFKRGFKELYLATGYEAGQFDDLPWIKKVVGKRPPFG
jgi:signal transduction histidine kinase